MWYWNFTKPNHWNVKGHTQNNKKFNQHHLTLFSSHFAKSPPWQLHLCLWSSLPHPGLPPSNGPHTIFHWAISPFQTHASCPQNTLLRKLFHPATWTHQSRAFGYFSILHCTFSHPASSFSPDPRFYCHWIPPHTLIRQARQTSLCHASGHYDAVYALINQLPLIRWSIGPFLNAESLLNIFKPLSIVARTIIIVVNTLSMGLIIPPFALIHVTVWMNKSTPSICFVILPITLVQWKIRPNLLSSSISHSSVELSHVPCTILHLRWCPYDC